MCVSHPNRQNIGRPPRPLVHGNGFANGDGRFMGQRPVFCFYMLLFENAQYIMWVNPMIFEGSIGHTFELLKLAAQSVSWKHFTSWKIQSVVNVLFQGFWTWFSNTYRKISSQCLSDVQIGHLLTPGIEDVALRSWQNLQGAPKYLTRIFLT